MAPSLWKIECSYHKCSSESLLPLRDVLRTGYNHEWTLFITRIMERLPRVAKIHMKQKVHKLHFSSKPPGHRQLVCIHPNFFLSPPFQGIFSKLGQKLYICIKAKVRWFLGCWHQWIPWVNLCILSAEMLFTTLLFVTILQHPIQSEWRSALTHIYSQKKYFYSLYERNGSASHFSGNKNRLNAFLNISILKQDAWIPRGN